MVVYDDPGRVRFGVAYSLAISILGIWGLLKSRLALDADGRMDVAIFALFLVVLGVLSTVVFVKRYLCLSSPALQITGDRLVVRSPLTAKTRSIRYRDVEFAEIRRRNAGRGYRYLIFLQMRNQSCHKIPVSNLSETPKTIFDELRQRVPWRDWLGLAETLDR